MAPDALETDHVSDADFVLAIGTDEKLLRRLNELDNAETVSVGTKGTDAKWRLKREDALGLLKHFAGMA